jgi:hypothetical protein
MELILSIILGFVMAGVGFLIGLAVNNKLEKQYEREVESLQRSLDSSPMVIECNLGQPLTLDQMIELLGHKFAAIRRKLGNGLQTLPPLRETAETILQWYNPESGYTKLVLVGYMRGGLARLAWTWQKQDTQDTKNYIMTQDAVEGLEKYYEDALGNPMVLGNQEG